MRSLMLRLPRAGMIPPGQFPDARIPTHGALEAGLVLPSSLISALADRMTALASRQRWPVITVFAHLPQSGILMAYGLDMRDMWRRAAAALGLRLPPALQVLADEVVQ